MQYVGFCRLILPPQKRDKNRLFFSQPGKNVFAFFTANFGITFLRIRNSEPITKCSSRNNCRGVWGGLRKPIWQKNILSSSCMEVQVSIPQWFGMQCKFLGSWPKARVLAPWQPLLRQSLLSPPCHPPRWYGERGGPCSCPGFMCVGAAKCLVPFLYNYSSITRLASHGSSASTLVLAKLAAANVLVVQHSNTIYHLHPLISYHFWTVQSSRDTRATPDEGSFPL